MYAEIHQHQKPYQKAEMFTYLDLPDLENFQGLRLNPRFVPQNQGFRKKPRFFQKPGFFQKSFSWQSEWDVFFQFY